MKIFLILISIFYTYSEILIAQSTMKIRKIDGTLSAYNLSRIDSIYFSTEIPSVTVKDIDGNAYKLVTIGTQVWFSENLKTTRYRNGDSIGTTIPAEKDILSEIAPKYQWAYNGDNSIVGVFGRLYTGNVVIDSRGVCPVGYHVPSDAEWTTLTDLLGGLSLAGNKLKEAGIIHWLSRNLGADNASGFSGLPGGMRTYNAVSGAFTDICRTGYWWVSSENSPGNAWFRDLTGDGSVVYRGSFNSIMGFSVRCIRD